MVVPPPPRLVPGSFAACDLVLLMTEIIIIKTKVKVKDGVEKDASFMFTVFPVGCIK